MKISTDDQRAIGLIFFCVGVLSFLIGLAGHFKSELPSPRRDLVHGIHHRHHSGGDRRRDLFGFVKEETRLTP